MANPTLKQRHAGYEGMFPKGWRVSLGGSDWRDSRRTIDVRVAVKGVGWGKVRLPMPNDWREPADIKLGLPASASDQVMIFGRGVATKYYKSGTFRDWTARETRNADIELRAADIEIYPVR